MLKRRDASMGIEGMMMTNVAERLLVNPVAVATQHGFGISSPTFPRNAPRNDNNTNSETHDVVWEDNPTLQGGCYLEWTGTPILFPLSTPKHHCELPTSKQVQGSVSSFVSLEHQ